MVAVAARPTSLLEGKTVLIAGVGPGLGREIGEVAVREGARVVSGRAPSRRSRRRPRTSTRRVRERSHTAST